MLHLALVNEINTDQTGRQVSVQEQIVHFRHGSSSNHFKNSKNRKQAYQENNDPVKFLFILPVIQEGDQRPSNNQG